MVIKSFRCTRGGAAIEYALIAALLVLAVITGMSALGSSMNESFTTTENLL